MKIYDAPVMTDPVGCIKFVRPNSRVLEFGTGTGYATRYMRDVLHCRVTGIECVPLAAEKAKPFAENMICADINSDNWSQSLDGCFDFVVFGDVLEHLRDPRLAVEKALKHLSPGGSVLTSVPNIGHNAVLLCLRKGLFTYNDYGLLDNTHVSFFTRKSLLEMFHGLGLYAAASNDSIVRPCLTEFNVHYLGQPLFSLCIVRRRDGHVYQFVNEWKMALPGAQAARKDARFFRLSPIRIVAELLYDCVHLLFNKLPRKTQTWLKTLFFR